MVHNLSAELARKRVSHKKVAELLSITEKTLFNKMQGYSEFTIKEAWTIKENLFPEHNIEYLFEIERREQ